MKLIIKNLTTFKCQEALDYSKDIAIRRVECKLPNLVDFFVYFVKIIYCMIDLQNKFKE